MFGPRTWAPPSNKGNSLNTDPKVRVSLLASSALMDVHIPRYSHFLALLYPEYLFIPRRFNTELCDSDKLDKKKRLVLARTNILAFVAV